jgi:hypothetical protein
VTLFSQNCKIDEMTSCNGMMFSSTDKFIILNENRDATEKEIQLSLNSIVLPSVPKIDISSAVVRQLSGIKPKRIIKSKKVIIEEEESDFSDSSSSISADAEQDGEDEEDGDEEEEEDEIIDDSECEDSE